MYLCIAKFSSGLLKGCWADFMSHNGAISYHTLMCLDFTRRAYGVHWNTLLRCQEQVLTSLIDSKILHCIYSSHGQSLSEYDTENHRNAEN